MDVQCTLNGPTVREMAAKSATSFLIHFYDANSKYLLEQYPSNGNLSYYWNFAQVSERTAACTSVCSNVCATRSENKRVLML
jgi:hypothetical protein